MSPRTFTRVVGAVFVVATVVVIVLGSSSGFYRVTWWVSKFALYALLALLLAALVRHFFVKPS